MKTKVVNPRIAMINLREQQLRERQKQEREERLRKLNAELCRLREVKERCKRDVEVLSVEYERRERAHKEMMRGLFPRLFPSITEQYAYLLRNYNARSCFAKAAISGKR